MQIEIENEQLIKRTEIETTPFTIVELDGKHFGTIGKYKITPDYETHEEAHNSVTQLTWNNITNLIFILNEIIKNQNEQ